MQENQEGYNLHPGIEPVSEERKQQLMEEAKAFSQYQQAQKRKDFFSVSYYYIVSLKWLNRWKVYVSYEEAIAGRAPTKFLGCGSLPTLNEDIIDHSYKADISFGDQFSHYNICLRNGLQENKDYVFVSEGMWNVINTHQNLEVKRMVVDSPDGKKVQLYYQAVTVVPISNEYLKDIEKEIVSVNKISTFFFQISHYLKISAFNDLVKQIIRQKLQYVYESRFSSTLPVRLWLLPQKFDKFLLFNTFLQGCKANSSFSYKLFLEGQRLDEDQMLSHYDIFGHSLLVLQMKEFKEEWNFFNKKNVIHSMCTSCRKVAELSFLCSCKYAAYCSKRCKDKDKSYHKFRCPNDGESDEEEQELGPTEDSMLGVVGLRNLGNTCFMNSGIQCVSHIPQLVQYFLSKSYINDINTENPLGTKGELCTSYAKVVQQLQYGKDSSISPTALKRSIGKFQPMFSGYDQHDSGELITYLLDGLHEDLNRVKKKPYVEGSDSNGRPDEIVAKEQWDNFLLRNKSEIVDLMYGQYRSVLDCPKCQNHSIQFDPFLMCSLPIINNSKKKIEITFLKEHVLCEKITICFDKGSGCRMNDILNQVRTKVNKPQARLVTYVASYASCDIIDQNRLANDVRSEYKYRTIFVRELEPDEHPDQDAKIILGNSICHSYYKDENYRKSLVPYRLYFVNKNTSLKDVHEKFIKYYRHIWEVNNYEAEVIHVDRQDQPVRLLAIAFSRYSSCEYCGKKSCEGCDVPYDDTITLGEFTKAVEEKPEFEIYWRKDDKNVELAFDKYTEGKGEVNQDPVMKKGDTSLYDCLKLFSEPEVLAEENEWFCPKCKDFVLARKQMHIYKAPKILILCLKRFKRKDYFQQKYNIFVDFPLENLNLSQFVLNHDLPHAFEQSIPTNMDIEKPDLMYDLFAISNHYGGTGGGHYTAYCKNPISNKWYDFDDSYVKQVSHPSDVISESAYILFYKRKDS